MWIKVCANTNLEDAKLAADLGADAVGFVFAESARKVTSAAVAEMVLRLPDTIEKIGVFSTQDAAEIARIVRQTGITGVQLHGGFDLELIQMLNADFGGSVTITQVLHWAVERKAADAVEFAERVDAVKNQSAVQRVLIDSKTKQGNGGTGQSFDWAAAHAALLGESEIKLIVAGGLDAENVGRAVMELRPWGVDVASGVEATKGRKDPVKLRAFMEAARKF